MLAKTPEQPIRALALKAASVIFSILDPNPRMSRTRIKHSQEGRVPAGSRLQTARMRQAHALGLAGNRPSGMPHDAPASMSATTSLPILQFHSASR
jgi:hypothetical protein